MAMDGLIEPDSFDLIVVGTGLPESILAAAAANAGRTVLHLDHLDFYGAHWTSLTFSQLCKWAGSGGSFAGPVLTPSNSSKEQDFGGNDSTGLTGSVSESGIEGSSRADALVDQSLGKENVDLNAEDARIDEARSEKSENVVTQDQRALGLEAIEVDYDKQLYWEVEVNECADVDLGASRFYNMDLAGPRLTFCGSQLVNLLLRSGASNYIEFKGVEATYMWTKTGLSAVPASRSDVFMDKSLSLSDKRFLMRFFKLVTDHANAEGAEISLETLESPFVEFMRLQNLPTSMQSIILYAIAFVDTDQYSKDCTNFLKTKDGFQRLSLYLSSVGRFSNAPTAFLYPLYGQGELAQAFCRSAAVNGALYVLRRPVKALLVDKESKDYRGVQTFSGQQIFSKKLVIGPSVVPKNGQEGGLASLVEEEVQSSLSKEAYTNVARFTCITDKSIFEGQTTLLVIFPPESVTESQSTVVRAMQLNSGASVCPDGKYLVQLSTICSDTSEGQQSLQAAVGMLFSRTEEEGSMSPLELDEKVAASNKPKLLWSVSYTQALHTDAKRLARPGIAAFDMPDGALDCEGILTSTQKTFNEFFPDSEFFKKVEPEDEKFAEEMEADFEAEDVETE